MKTITGKFVSRNFLLKTFREMAKLFLADDESKVGDFIRSFMRKYMGLLQHYAEEMRSSEYINDDDSLAILFYVLFHYAGRSDEWFKSWEKNDTKISVKSFEVNYFCRNGNPNERAVGKVMSLCFQDEEISEKRNNWLEKKLSEKIYLNPKKTPN